MELNKDKNKKSKWTFIISLNVGLIAFFMYTQFIDIYPEELLEKNILEQDLDISYEISKSKYNDNYFVFHYPETNIKQLDDWILDVKIETLNHYQEKFKDKENHTLKQEYDVYDNLNRYLSVELKIIEDGEIVGIDAKTFDKKENKFVSASIFNTKAKRFLTYQIRENAIKNVDRKEFLNQTVITDDFDQLYIKENKITLYHPLSIITIDINKDNDYLHDDFLNTKKGNPDNVPSVYLDYGYDKEDKLIAITFDDGPFRKNSIKIMDIFDKYDAKATFFLLGTRVAGEEATIKQFVDRGHQIASHSFSHPNFTKLKTKEIKKELVKTEKNIEKATLHKENLFVRPPYGALNDKQLKNLDYVFVNWSVDTLDWKTRDPKKICQYTKEYSYDGSILLMHELYDTTVESLECVLKSLSKEGYKFVTVKELFDAKEIDINTNKIYYDAIKK